MPKPRIVARNVAILEKISGDVNERGKDFGEFEATRVGTRAAVVALEERSGVDDKFFGVDVEVDFIGSPSDVGV
jgi:hypothetical protein